MISILTGDWRFFWPDVVPTLCHFPSAWDPSLNTGLGIPAANTLWITSYLNLTSCFSHIGIPWNFITLFFFLLPSFFITCFSAYFLVNHVIQNKRYSIVGSVIYTTNTYFLLLLTGGQMGITLAYGVIPLVILGTIILFNEPTLKRSLALSLIIALQVWWDIRVAYIAIICMILYFPFGYRSKKVLGYSLLSLGFVLALHMFWILTSALGGSSTPTGFGNISSVYFFSFADFAHAISLLHPNWPENIFGKTYFLQPEFLLIPLMAFLSLLFHKKKPILIFLYFGILALLGTFLAKGATDPFGFVYTFLFSHVLGFVLFRDPTKFYILISIAYTVLIPYSLMSVELWLKKPHLLKFPAFSPLIFFIIIWLFLSRQDLIPLANIFVPHTLPSDYRLLASLETNQKTFFRTLWVPVWQRYRYLSDEHPATELQEVFPQETTVDGQFVLLQKNSSKTLLQQYGIKYIVVPYDSEREIFLTDRHYDEKKFQDYKQNLEKIPWLRKVSGFKNMAVFEIDHTEPHFYIFENPQKISIDAHSEFEYRIHVFNVRSGNKLIFSENFNKGWVAYIGGGKIESVPYKGLNSFNLPVGGSYDVRIFFAPQRFVFIGFGISFITAFTIILLLLCIR